MKQTIWEVSVVSRVCSGREGAIHSKGRAARWSFFPDVVPVPELIEEGGRRFSLLTSRPKRRAELVNARGLALNVGGATRVGGAGEISIGTGDATWLSRSAVVVGFRDMLEAKESSRSSEMSSKLSLGTGLEAFLVGRLGTWRRRLAVWDGKREGIALGRRWNGWSLFDCLMGRC